MLLFAPKGVEFEETCAKRRMLPLAVAAGCVAMYLRHLIAFEEHTDNHTALTELLVAFNESGGSG